MDVPDFGGASFGAVFQGAHCHFTQPLLFDLLFSPDFVFFFPPGRFPGHFLGRPELLFFLVQMGLQGIRFPVFRIFVRLVISRIKGNAPGAYLIHRRQPV